MKRGDVVRTRAEFDALPMGSQVIAITGYVYEREDFALADEMAEDLLPALVRVVGPVEPEWLEAAGAAITDDTNHKPYGRWKQTTDSGRRYYREMARAAVEAADKARGIVNSREEFDALPAGTVVHTGHGAWYRVGDFGKPYPVEWPCVFAR